MDGNGGFPTVFQVKIWSHPIETSNLYMLGHQVSGKYLLETRSANGTLKNEKCIIEITFTMYNIAKTGK